MNNLYQVYKTFITCSLEASKKNVPGNVPGNDVFEDEQHALLVCHAHYGLRTKFRDKIKWTSVSDMLDPENEDDLITIAEYIKAIEANMDALTMGQ